MTFKLRRINFNALLHNIIAKLLKVATLVMHVKVILGSGQAIRRNLNKHRRNIRIAHEAHANRLYAVVDVHARGNRLDQVEWVEVPPRLVEHFEWPRVLSYQVLRTLATYRA